MAAARLKADAAKAAAESTSQRLADAAKEVGIHQQALSGLFGPSEEAEKAFQELSASWAGFQKAGVPTDPRFKFLQPTYDAWFQFSSAWKSGDGDTSNLNSMVADARRVSLEIAKVNPSAPPITYPANLSLEQIHPQTTAIAQETAPLVAVAEGAVSDVEKQVTKTVESIHLPFWVYPVGALTAILAVVVGTRSLGFRVA